MKKHILILVITTTLLGCKNQLNQKEELAAVLTESYRLNNILLEENKANYFVAKSEIPERYTINGLDELNKRYNNLISATNKAITYKEKNTGNIIAQYNSILTEIQEIFKTKKLVFPKEIEVTENTVNPNTLQLLMLKNKLTLAMAIVYNTNTYRKIVADGYKVDSVTSNVSFIKK